MKIGCEELHALLHDVSDGEFDPGFDHDVDLEAMGIDSLALHEFAAAFQDRFATMIPDESLGRMRTLSDLERAVSALAGGGAGRAGA